MLLLLTLLTVNAEAANRAPLHGMYRMEERVVGGGVLRIVEGPYIGALVERPDWQRQRLIVHMGKPLCYHVRARKQGDEVAVSLNGSSFSTGSEVRPHLRNILVGIDMPPRPRPYALMLVWYTDQFDSGGVYTGTVEHRCYLVLP